MSTKAYDKWFASIISPNPPDSFMRSVLISILSEAADHTDLSVSKVTKLRIGKIISKIRIFDSKIHGLSATLNQYYKKLFPQLFRKTVQKQNK